LAYRSFNAIIVRSCRLGLVLKEKRRGYFYCKNNDKFDIVKNLAKPRKAKVLRMPEKWPINILSLLHKENWDVQKVNAGIARSCRLGQNELTSDQIAK
jgi:hypothetical protein